MSVLPPATRKIYHIAHYDRLSSIVADGFLWCEARVQQCNRPGTSIGITDIKRRRSTNRLKSHPTLNVGDCVPFYFCPRSVMLYVLHMANSAELSYRDGQDPIVHLEADLKEAVAWADREGLRWAFTTSNAGSRYFDDYNNLAQLDKVDWKAVEARDWRKCKDLKQAEFLIEASFPWTLFRRIGVRSQSAAERAHHAICKNYHKPVVEVKPEWYY